MGCAPSVCSGGGVPPLDAGVSATCFRSTAVVRPNSKSSLNRLNVFTTAHRLSANQKRERPPSGECNRRKYVYQAKDEMECTLYAQYRIDRFVVNIVQNCCMHVQWLFACDALCGTY